MYKIRTIDVWDTLLRRDCHPECIKLATAHHLLFGWRDQIKSEFLDGWVLYRARLEAERTLAVQAKAGGKDDEYEITQVLAQWSRAIFADTVPPELPNCLAEFELSVELARSYADTDIIEFVRSHEAEKTLFLSDFYMRSEMLGRLLTVNGLAGLAKEGISSCDVGLNKRSGRLFRHVHKNYSISPGEHLHIGDNEWSDVATPQSLGIRSLHYQPGPEQKKRILLERLFLSRDSLLEHIQRECSKLVKEQGKRLPPKQLAAMCIGAESSTLFIGFALWLAEQSILERLDRVYFLTREGEFFHKLFCTLFPNNSLFGHSLPPTDILAVSRLSTFSASLRSISTKEMLRIWSLFKVQSISGLFDTLGINKSKFNELLDRLGLGYSDIIRDPENNAKLASLFESPSFTEAAINASKHNRALLKSYLDSKNVFSAKRIGIVDIGWRGTIQDNIALIIPDIHIHGMYLGLRPFLNHQPTNTSKASFGPNENISQKPSKLFENFSSMEMLCNSPFGSVSGYSMKESSISPDRVIDQSENMAHESFVKPFQDGVLLAGHIWSHYINAHVISSNEIRDISLSIWDALRKNPCSDLAHAYLSSPQIDIFGYGEIFRRNRFPSLFTILSSPISRSERNKLIDFVRRVQWSAAIAHAQELGLIHKALLLTVFHIANISKRTLLRVKLITNKTRRKCDRRIDRHRDR